MGVGQCTASQGFGIVRIKGDGPPEVLHSAARFTDVEIGAPPSLVGIAGTSLSRFPDLIEEFGLDSLESEMATGDLFGLTSRGQRAHMYRWSELEALLKTQDCEIVGRSASTSSP